MAWYYDAVGSATDLSTGVAAMTGDGSAEETAVLPNVIGGAQGAVSQFDSLNSPASIHMVVQGHADKSAWTVNISIQAVHLDPQGRIIANAYPAII